MNKLSINNNCNTLLKSIYKIDKDYFIENFKKNNLFEKQDLLLIQELIGIDIKEIYLNNIWLPILFENKSIKINCYQKSLLANNIFLEKNVIYKPKILNFEFKDLSNFEFSFIDCRNGTILLYEISDMNSGNILFNAKDNIDYESDKEIVNQIIYSSIKGRDLLIIDNNLSNIKLNNIYIDLFTNENKYNHLLFNVEIDRDRIKEYLKIDNLLIEDNLKTYLKNILINNSFLENILKIKNLKIFILHNEDLIDLFEYVDTKIILFEDIEQLYKLNIILTFDNEIISYINLYETLYVFNVFFNESSVFISELSFMKLDFLNELFIFNNIETEE